MERIKNITKAFDKRDPDPKKNYGIHGAELRMVLKGELGATQFVLYTNRHLETVQAEFLNKYFGDSNREIQDKLMQYSGAFSSDDKAIEEIIAYHKYLHSPEVATLTSMKQTHGILVPLPADLGYHSPVPQYEGQLPIGVTRQYDDEYNEIGTEGECRPCEYLNGKCCYYDGSGLNAQRVYDRMIREGEEEVWKELESYYVQLFGELK